MPCCSEVDCHPRQRSDNQGVPADLHYCCGVGSDTGLNAVLSDVAIGNDREDNSHDGGDGNHGSVDRVGNGR